MGWQSGDLLYIFQGQLPLSSSKLRVTPKEANPSHGLPVGGRGMLCMVRGRKGSICSFKVFFKES